MDAREREFVSTLHACLASGTLCYPKRDRVRLGNGEWGDGEWEIEVLDEYADDETRRAYTAWWPPDAPGYVTMTLDGGQFRRKSATGWWTLYVAAYTIREAYHLASRGEWAPDAFTAGIRRMFHSDGAVVLKPTE